MILPFEQMPWNTHECAVSRIWLMIRAFAHCRGMMISLELSSELAEILIGHFNEQEIFDLTCRPMHAESPTVVKAAQLVKEWLDSQPAGRTEFV